MIHSYYMAKKNTGYRLVLNKYDIYEIRWCENGRSKRLTTKTSNYDKALEFSKKYWAKDYIENKEKDLLSTQPDIKTILDFYLHIYCQSEVADVLRQEVCINHLNKSLGSYTPNEITPEIIHDYKEQAKLRRDVCDATIRRELVCLCAALNLAMKHKKIKEMPVIDLPKHSPPKEIWLDEKERDLLWKIGVAQNQDGTIPRINLFICIALETAARKNSILTLKWSQIDFEAKLIRFDNDGKNKTDKRRVAIPISDKLLPIIKRAHQLRTTDFVMTDTSSIQRHWDFTFHTMTQVYPDNKKWQQLTPHCLRKTWATLAARSGVDMFSIAGVLGDNITTVYKNYAFHSPGHLRDAINFRK